MFGWLMKKPKISLEITQAQSDQLRAESDERGMSLSDLVRERLFEDHPTAAQTAVAPAPNVVAPPVVPATSLARHPCLYLSVAMPVNYSARDCKGTCTSPVQNGRPCFWGAAQAPSCDKFRAFVVRHR